MPHNGLMATSPKDQAMSRRRVALVVPEDAILLDLAVPMQLFGAWPDAIADRAGVRSGYELIMVGASDTVGRPFGHGARIEHLARALEADMVVVPGVADPSRPAGAELVRTLVSASAGGAMIAAICTGAFALAEAGLLAGRRITTHWAWAPDLRRRYPDVIVEEQHLYLIDGTVATSGGVMAGMDLCLQLIKQDHGREIANAVARFVVSPPNRTDGQALFIDPAPVAHDPQLAPVLRFIDDNLCRPLSLESVAVASHLSTRTLTRRFRAVTGSTVNAWIAMRRVTEARRLLESTDLSVLAVAHRVGFGSAESMRLHFMTHVGCSPAQYRRTFA